MSGRIRKLSEVREPTPAELRSCRLQLEHRRDKLRKLLGAAGRPDRRERISAKLEAVEKQLAAIAGYWPGE